MRITEQLRIIKDEKGTYRTAIARKEIDKETGEEKTYFKRMLVGFKKGLPEVKNKAKININSGFLTWFPMELDELDENGNKKTETFWKIIITDFDIVEEGIDEVETSYSNRKQKEKNPNDYSSFVISEDDLPF